MTVEEVFKEVGDHQMEGAALHGELVDYFSYLGLHGFCKKHRKRFREECREVQCLRRWFIDHCGTVLPYPEGTTLRAVVPEAWYTFDRSSMEPGAVRDAVRSAMERWMEWERSTRGLYERCIAELCAEGEMVASCEMLEMAEKADREYMCVCDMVRELHRADWSMEAICAMDRRLIGGRE